MYKINFKKQYWHGKIFASTKTQSLPKRLINYNNQYYVEWKTCYLTPPPTTSTTWRTIDSGCRDSGPTLKTSCPPASSLSRGGSRIFLKGWGSSINFGFHPGGGVPPSKMSHPQKCFIFFNLSKKKFSEEKYLRPPTPIWIRHCCLTDASLSLFF